MKLNAIGVTSSNIKETVRFYELLGFKFQNFNENDMHIESIPSGDEAKLMIDAKELVHDIINQEPKPSNHSAFAAEYNSPQEVDTIAKTIKDLGYTIVKEPWDAFWGQRYCIVADPDGYMVDLYARL